MWFVTSIWVEPPPPGTNGNARCNHIWKVASVMACAGLATAASKVHACMSSECISHLYYASLLNEVRIFVNHSYIQVDTWKCGWSYTPNTIHKMHCSTWYNSLKILFIATLPLQIVTLFIIFLHFIHGLFIIHINLCLFLFFFFPCK